MRKKRDNIIEHYSTQKAISLTISSLITGNRKKSFSNLVNNCGSSYCLNIACNRYTDSN